jgi:hypothetical protein
MCELTSQRTSKTAPELLSLSRSLLAALKYKHAIEEGITIMPQTTTRYGIQVARPNDLSDRRHVVFDPPQSGIIWNAVRALCLLFRLVQLSLSAALSLCIFALIGPPGIALILIVIGDTIPAVKPACDALLNGLSWLLHTIAHLFYPSAS